MLLNFHLQEPFNYRFVPFYFLLGIVCGLFSYYYSRVYLATESFVRRKKYRATRVLLGGVGLFLLILFLPPLFGEGYNSIKSLSDLKATDLFQSLLFRLTILINRSYMCC